MANQYSLKPGVAKFCCIRACCFNTAAHPRNPLWVPWYGGPLSPIHEEGLGLEVCEVGPRIWASTWDIVSMNSFLEISLNVLECSRLFRRFEIFQKLRLIIRRREICKFSEDHLVNYIVNCEASSKQMRKLPYYYRKYMTRN